jgi:NAD(P)-dependent dehydrogenase (short-subunit alcohol dehydrogenase family)
MGLLSDKVTVILGASDRRSMGAAAARKCLAEGATVIIASRNEDKVKALAAGLGCEGHRCDIRSDDDLKALASHAVAHGGALHVAMNFAGIEAASPIADLERATLLDAADVHFAGTVMFIRFMAEQMADNGAIVTTSSQLASLPAPGMTAYGGSKAGADHAVRIAANEYGARGIRVNAIAPGFTPSAMTAAYLEMPSVEAAFRKEIALPRLPSVEDMANAAAWLASDDCFVTGDVLDLSAGQTLRRIPTPEEMMGPA